MLIKDCKNYLLSECANCGCHLKKEDIVTQETVTVTESNLSENNFNINDISFIYKIPPEELISNVLSHITKQSGQPPTQFGNLTVDECSQMDFVFCKTCEPMFEEVYRSHKTFHLWSAVGNLISKAIQPYSRLQQNNVPKSNLTGPEIDIKSETDDKETDSIEETGNWENNFVFIEPANQYENLYESESQNNDPLSEDIKFEIESVDFGNNQNNSDSFSEIVTYTISNDGDGSIIYNTLESETVSESGPGNQVFANTIADPQRSQIKDDTNNLLIPGPPFHCPRCTKIPPFPYPNGLRLHCKIDHQLVIPDSAFSKEALKNSDVKYTTHPTFIKGPPFQCPICIERCNTLNKFKNHCKTVHLLLLPRQRIARQFSCRLCEKEFGNNAKHWRKHYRSLHNCRFVCRLCKIGFETNEDLQSHFETDCGGNTSLSKATTTTNSRSVADCEEVCNKSFEVAESLKNHKLTHTVVKPYQCEVCNKSFAVKKILKAHLQAHTDERNFSAQQEKIREYKSRKIICKICGKEFMNPTSLKNHEKYVHLLGVENPHKCRVCGKLFASKTKFGIHKITHGSLYWQ